jgi:hypothetical protein
MKINKTEAIKLARKYKIDLDVVPIEEWQYGLNVELEHGSKLSKLTNITKNNKDLTSRIVISHLLENHQYYKYLKKMEDKMDKIWAKKNKPDIFLE